MIFRHPYTRIQRNKRHHWIREMFAENHIQRSQLILPIFVKEGESISISSMPSVNVLSVDLCVEMVKKAYDQGICAVALFPRIDSSLKDEMGSYALSPNNLICKTIAILKKAVPKIGVIADIALDPYTTHRHDGVLDNEGFIDNDKTIEILAKQALILADSGCDILAPSDMMDGRVFAIRSIFEKHKFSNVQIFSYSAKYASILYKPFRDAINSGNCLDQIDKKHYQLNPANINDAVKKVKLDISEGADAVIVKPALFYLDVVREIKREHPIPVIAYQVSGEYAMLKIAAEHGLYSYEDAQIEFLLSCKRAGASCIMTYGALEIASLL